MRNLFTISAITTLLIGVQFAVAQKMQPTGKPAAISLTISAVEEMVKVGSSFRLMAVIKNVSDHDIVVIRGFRSRGYYTEVRDSSGDLAPETELGQFLSGHLRWEKMSQEQVAKYITDQLINIPLKVGKSWTDEIQVSDRYNIQKPGKYTIQATTGDPESITRMKSNTITVTVTQ